MVLIPWPETKLVANQFERVH